MEKRRIADDRTAIEEAIDILTKLTNGHSLRMVHGVSTRQIVAARDELAKVLAGLGNYAH
ncbi:MULTISPECIES: hypothetical protein [Serratia]|nr:MULTISPECIES: hypothetical protein [Serratia]CAI2030305.1 Uncharacterised protein [Serratia ficaria]CAI2528442.1 Uncharacterised protein [Serratia ficaria]CAI2540251.1 Uncharacterised protein [Serratia ficaria]CAI2794184.1 Uncharacterised protein [Serratia ficaria]